MINIVTISTKNETSGTQFPTAFEIDGKKRVLLSLDGEFKDYGLSEKDALSGISINFNKNFKKLTFRFESDKSLQTEQDRKIEILIREFFYKNPSVTVDGKPTKYTKTDIFNLCYENKVINYKYEQWNKMLAIANCISESSDSKKVDICHYYGINPTNLSKEEITLKLASYSEGILFRSPVLDEFEGIWMNENAGDREMIVICKKALIKEIITTRYSENRPTYYIGNTQIGTTFNDIIAYCKLNPNIYNEYVARQMTETALPIKHDVLISEEEKNMDTDKKEMRDALYSEYVSLYKQGFAKIRPHHLTKTEKLKVLVSEAKKRKEESLQTA